MRSRFLLCNEWKWFSWSTSGPHNVLRVGLSRFLESVFLKLNSDSKWLFYKSRSLEVIVYRRCVQSGRFRAVSVTQSTAVENDMGGSGEVLHSALTQEHQDISLSLYLSLCLTFSHSISFSHSLSLSYSVSLTLLLSLSYSLSLYLSLSHSISFSHSLSLTLTLLLSLLLSLTISPTLSQSL